MGQSYSKDQVVGILKSAIDRLSKDAKAFELKREGNKITFYKYAIINSTDKTNIYISLDGETPGSIYVSLNNHSAFYYPSIFWWRDKELKEYMRILTQFAVSCTDSASIALNQCFPEITAQEFERHILQDSNQK